MKLLTEWRTGLPDEFKELIGVLDRLIALVFNGLEKKTDIAHKVVKGTEKDAGNIDSVISGILFDEGRGDLSNSSSKH